MGQPDAPMMDLIKKQTWLLDGCFLIPSIAFHDEWYTAQNV